MTNFSEMKEGKVTKSMSIDLNKLDSPDPIAFAYGVFRAECGDTLPPENTKEYRGLAKEYIRGFKSVATPKKT